LFYIWNFITENEKGNAKMPGFLRHLDHNKEIKIFLKYVQKHMDLGNPYETTGTIYSISRKNNLNHEALFELYNVIIKMKSYIAISYDSDIKNKYEYLYEIYDNLSTNSCLGACPKLQHEIYSLNDKKLRIKILKFSNVICPKVRTRAEKSLDKSIKSIIEDRKNIGTW
jgi:hypothetical protein